MTTGSYTLQEIKYINLNVELYYQNTVVWEKFVVGNIHEKNCDKKFSF